MVLPSESVEPAARTKPLCFQESEVVATRIWIKAAWSGESLESRPRTVDRGSVSEKS